MANKTGSSRFTTRRSFLLDRAAWSCGSLAVLFAFFYSESNKWMFVAGFAALGVVCWLLASKFEKGARARKAYQADEKGNAIKKVL